MAQASASAASAVGAPGRFNSLTTMCCTCSLAALPLPTTDKAAEQHPGDSAYDCANRAFGHTDARATGGSSQCADGTGSLTPPVEVGDAHAVTVGTDHGHGMTPLKMGIAPPLRIHGMQRESGMGKVRRDRRD